MIIDESEIMHYGILRRSGRYPWGSENNVVGRSKSFLNYIDDMRRQGLTDPEIARGIGMKYDDNNPMSTTDFRALNTIAKNKIKQQDIARAKALKDKGHSNVAIGKLMGKNESVVRSLLEPSAKDKSDVLTSTTDMLKRKVDEKEFIDVGSGVEQHIGITENKLRVALSMLKQEGYGVFTIPVPQAATGKNTSVKVLVAPGKTWGDVAKNKANIQQISDFSTDHGLTWLNIKPPLSLDPSRVKVNYAETGGAEADGILYIRPNVKDVSIGNSRYAQVRVAVGDSHYLKGMAVYKDDLPDGIDVMFNTNKSNTGNKFDAMKPISDDPDNPFGSTIKHQLIEVGKDGKQRVTSSMNIIEAEGGWQGWSRNLSSQMLSKQTPGVAKEQLRRKYEEKAREFDEISNLTNPSVKRKLLEAFAGDADSSAVTLRAAAFRDQASHVILPVSSMSPTEIYAPNYKNGTRVALVRHPHGGTFEIPELIVNNNNPEAKRLLGENIRDAVGIHHSVAERLSGADFDGDVVVVIPNNSGKIKSSPALEELKGFNPRESYKAYEGMPPITSGGMQTQMGLVSNLITDMTIKGASTSEIARAVKHSMVVIDSYKHNLDYKQSAIDNGILSLRKKYQTNPETGRSGAASTLISRARSAEYVKEKELRKASEGGSIDPLTGKKVYVETGNTYINKKGEVVPRMTKSTKLAETDDANTLSSGTPIERIYAEHSNKLKALANRARLEAIRSVPKAYSPSANKVYAKEVSSLTAKLNLAIRNRPLERQANIIADTVYRAKLADNPHLDHDQRKKIKFQALTAARSRVGASQQSIKITQSEWDAIQAGAISPSRLDAILTKADLDLVKKYATPRAQRVVSPSKLARARAMLGSGSTRAEVASALGIPLGTLDEALYA